jgi:hypothetical protein
VPRRQATLGRRHQTGANERERAEPKVIADLGGCEAGGHRPNERSRATLLVMAVDLIATGSRGAPTDGRFLTLNRDRRVPGLLVIPFVTRLCRTIQSRPLRRRG